MPSSSGPGPNGLAAAIVLARAGRSVLVREAASEPGGGVRSGALTLPGFIHDVCSAVYPLGIASPFFRTLPLAAARPGVDPPAGPAGPPAGRRHGGAAGAVHAGDRRMARAGRRRLAAADGPVRLALARSFCPRSWDRCSPPRHPLLLGALRDASGCCRRPAGADGVSEATARGRCSPASPAHATLPLNQPPSAAFGLVLGLAGHAAGWPIPRGGAGADHRRRWFRTCARWAAPSRPTRRSTSVDDLPPSRAVLLDVTARAGAARRRHAADRRRTAGELERFQYGLGHVQGGLGAGRPDPLARRRSAPGPGRSTWAARWRRSWLAARPSGPGQPAERPLVLLSQPTLFDPTRAPAGQAHRLGLLPRAERQHRGHDGARSRPRSSGSRRASATGSSARHAMGAGRLRAPQPELRRRGHQRRRGDAAAVVLPPGPAAGARTPRRTRACSSARPRRRRAAASTACAASTPRRTALRRRL